ncbi:MAG: hypothetical protein HQ509_12105 [Candidatus Marinimicrobia bacterium]|nr:hypothetical protein [Candidatus Neomarinimicrobiota bacterium]
MILCAVNILFSADLKSIFQSDSDEEQEIYLSFRYQGGVNTVVIAYMKGENYYIPISQVFSLLKINHTINNNTLAISGYYINENNIYRIGLKSRVMQLGLKRWEISSNDFLIKELDYYINTKTLEQIFNLQFTVDINRLVLKLETRDKLPVVAQYERQQQRRKEFQLGTVDDASYEILSNRNRQVFNGTYMDYSFFSRFAGIGNMYNYRVQFGNELLFGDIQGAFLGNHTISNNSYSLSSLRWRYVFEGGNDIEQLYIGENTSTGIGELPYTGLRITNEPVDPLKAYDLYVLDGTTNPESEVELYENDRLIEYQKADEKGYYRFSIPLSYGSSNIRLRIYNPTGGIETIEKRIQVPYTFLPTGKVFYNVHMGRGSDMFTPWEERPTLLQSDVGYGLTNWLTARSGIEYVEGDQTTKPIFFQTASFRFLGQYLGNVNIAPGSFYSFSTDIITPTQRSLNVGYNYYPKNSIYDQSGTLQNINLGIYFPFNIKQFPLTIQLSPSLEQRHDVEDLSQGLSWDISTQYKRLRIRSGFRDYGPYGNPFGRGKYSTAVMLTIPRTSAYPKLVRGLYMRGETSYSFSEGMDEVSLQFLRQVSRKSRFRLLLRKRPKTKGLQFEIGFTFDFDKNRQTTNYRKLGEDYIFTYSTRGSIGFNSLRDRYYTNRNQVGRSSIGVRLFVDENNSGTYDNNEEILSGKAIRLVKSSGQMEEKNGQTIVTQLQPYKQYNFVVNKANIKNPTLAPKYDAFAIVTDPNQTKQIDIPLYVTGILEGQVARLKGGQPQPIAGLRIILKQQDSDYETTVTTFYDGSYYAMEVPPGSYSVTVDENQLSFLNVSASPAIHYIEIKALAEGDFIEGLDFILTSKN